MYHLSKQTTESSLFLPIYKVSFGFISHQNHDFWESMSCGGRVCIWGVREGLKDGREYLPTETMSTINS